MSKRSVERRNHDERQRGRPGHLARMIREEGWELTECEHCGRPVPAGSIKECYGCCTSFCVHCLKGSYCEPCNADFDADMDVLDDYLDPYSRSRSGACKAEECVDCADVDREVDYGTWYDDDPGDLGDY